MIENIVLENIKIFFSNRWPSKNKNNNFETIVTIGYCRGLLYILRQRGSDSLIIRVGNIVTEAVLLPVGGSEQLVLSNVSIWVSQHLLGKDHTLIK